MVPDAGHSIFHNVLVVLHQIPGIIHNIPRVIGPGV